MGAGGGKLITDARADVSAANDLTVNARKDYLALFDSVERVQNLTAAGSTATQTTGPRFDLPFKTVAAALAANKGRKYNSYAHSFGGMTVQFLLFIGIDLGGGLFAHAPP